jgi:hypothetical protein
VNVGEVFAHEIIAEFRRLIVKSAGPAINSSPNLCEKGKAVGELTALTKVCPRLRLNQTAIKLSEEIARQQSSIACQNQAATSLRLRLETMSAIEVAATCERALLRIQAGNADFLETIN